MFMVCLCGPAYLNEPYSLSNAVMQVPKEVDNRPLRTP